MIRYLVLVGLGSLIPFVGIQAQWVQTNGPSGKGGVVFSSCVLDSIVFAGLDRHLLKSTNEGKSWRDVTPTLVNPEADNAVVTLWANKENVFASIGASGDYLSTDRGETWIPPSMMSPRRQTIGGWGKWIIASTPYQGSAVTESTDGGLTWFSPPSFPPTIGVYVILVSPSSAIVSSGQGVYVSKDTGATWIKTQDGAAFLGLAMGRSGDHVVEAMYNIVKRSSDGGMTWSPDSVVLPCTWINAILLTSDGMNAFAATDSGVFRSTNFGASWKFSGPSVVPTGMYTLSEEVGGTYAVPILFASGGSGMYRSTDLGDSWTNAGLPQGSSWCLTTWSSTVVASHSSSINFGPSPSSIGTYSFVSDFFQTTNNGDTWIELDPGRKRSVGIVSSLLYCPTGVSEGKLFAGYKAAGNMGVESSGLIASSDFGVTWDSLFSAQVDVGALGQNAAGIFAGGINLHFSSDGGAHWAIPDSSVIGVSAFAFEGAMGFAGGSYLGPLPGLRSPGVVSSVSVSTDGGITWAPANLAIPTNMVLNANASALTCLYASHNHLLVGMRAYQYGVPGAAGGGVYHFRDSATKWLAVDSTLLGASVFALTEARGSVFAATSQGVMRSTDDGSHWIDISDGLSEKTAYALAAANGYLFAATEAGVWRRPLAEVTAVQENPSTGLRPDHLHLSQNYPNPFNPKTVISGQWTADSWVRLVVYDLLGREIAVLANGRYPAGRYTFSFDGTNLASGVYLCRLSAGANSAVRKMLLVR